MCIWGAFFLAEVPPKKFLIEKVLVPYAPKLLKDLRIFMESFNISLRLRILLHKNESLLVIFGEAKVEAKFTRLFLPIKMHIIAAEGTKNFENIGFFQNNC